MSEIPESYLKFNSQFEGGKANVKNDKGGLTNRGWTVPTFKFVLAYGLKNGIIPTTFKNATINNINDRLFALLHKSYFTYNSLDKIENSKIALMIYEYILGAPITYQRIANLLRQFSDTVSKDIGTKNADIINKLTKDQQNQLLKMIYEDRYQHLNQIVAKDPTQKVFLQGWLNRLNSFIKNDFSKNTLSLFGLGAIFFLSYKIYQSIR